MAVVSFEYSKTSEGVTIERYSGSTPVVDVPYSIAGANVTKIGAKAFAGCVEIKKINIPFCVTEIALDAFEGCTCLKEIFWSTKLIKLGGNSVKFCGNEIHVPKSFAVRKAPKEIAPRVPAKLLKTPVEDFNFVHTTEGVVIAKYRGNAAVVVVPPKIDGASVIGIGFDAFGGCVSLLELRLPDGLKSINWRALDGCANLQSVYMPRSLLDDEDTTKLIAALPEGCKVYQT